MNYIYQTKKETKVIATSIGILLVLLVILPIVLLYTVAKGSWQATFIPEGNIALFLKGEDLWKIVPNINGHTINDDGEIVPGHHSQSLLQKRFGFYWVSILYPIRSVMRFNIRKETLRTASELGSNPSIKDWVGHDQDEEVSSLRWKFQRPFLIRSVELGKDRTRVDIVVIATFQVIRPYIPIFVYKGKFFTLLEASIRSAALDYCSNKNLGYKELVTEKKKQGGKLSNAICKINESPTRNAPGGIVHAFGIKVVEAWVHDYELVADDRAVVEAARSEELQRLQAQGAIQKAMGEAKAFTVRGEGEASRYANLVKALTDAGVSPDNAALIVGQQVRTENVRDSKLTTYVEGGSSVMPTLPLKGGVN